jgi:hypothetical protein
MRERAKSPRRLVWQIETEPNRLMAVFGYILCQIVGCRWDYEQLETSSGVGRGGQAATGGIGGLPYLAGGASLGGSAIDLGGSPGSSGAGTVSGGVGGEFVGGGTTSGGTTGMSSGGNIATGGTSAGGNIATGGTSAGGVTGTGGNIATGGTSAGGVTGTGGNIATGGTSAGGVPGTGGNIATGGTSAGGVTGTGGASGTLAAGCTWSSFAGITYAPCQTLLTFPEAVSTCNSMGMELIRIDSRAENDWAAAAATDGWMGASDGAVEGEWRWADGTLFWLGDNAGAAVGGLFTNWTRTEPNGAPPSSNCARFESLSKTWVDVSCVGRFPFICE